MGCCFRGRLLTGETLRISLDAMGGDFGPPVVVPAALEALKHHPDLELVLVGDEAVLSREIKEHKAGTNPRLCVHHASETVGMDEAPSKALRYKKDSSMRVAIDLVKHGKVNACVSAGNTGALMATARFVLKTIPGIDRPAILSAIPSLRGHTHMLDLGANADCDSEQLFQFAVMGSVLASAVNDVPEPRVGLLNIGEEEGKGVERVKKAGELLAGSSLNYVGFVEGNDIYTGEVDVVVCDGFSGNVALKTSEGLATMVSHYIREEFSRNWYTRLAGLGAWPVLSALRERMDPRAYNGASLLGLQGIVLKSHGGADSFAFANAIRMALLEVRREVPRSIGDKVASALGEADN